MGRRKLVEDDELLAVVREAFVERGIAARTREIARRAGISEAVIYQRHPTKAHLFFAAMVPPALNVQDLLAAPAHDRSVVAQLEEIALGMMRYFREVVPILLRLVTHPAFDVEQFVQRHPDSPFGRLHLGLIQYLESQRARGRIVAEPVGPAALTLFAIVFGLGLVGNPLLWPRPVGGAFFNLILLGYAIPAALSVVLALITRGQRPQVYSVVAAIVAVGLAIAYLTLEVRTLYHGPVLTDGETTDAEQYTYSTVWLAFGVLLLGLGYVLRAQSVRIASAAVVVLTVFKVFFVDMSDLTGLWQALSVLGLGIVLLGIGRFYQQLLFPRRLQGTPTTT